MQSNRVPGSLRSDGFSAIAVGKPTRALLHQLAAKAGVPLSQYLKEFAEDEARDKQLALPGQSSADVNLAQVAKNVSDLNSVVLACAALTLAITRGMGIKGGDYLDPAIISEIEQRVAGNER